ncbi:hypothetical protein MK851_03105 [Tenacibaculum sp. 1B UA]|uniref:hypothetical protein n=1 Tax=Tenacibaculum sp. 1B UA TaxID=2922252 RepID=UPI002A2487A9|nr:hypothetical protein [Tenacibaculum sp. 1B UA]MDX8552610.1 hypothetical protein [Tenacibaculum sp. 1B UA]
MKNVLLIALLLLTVSCKQELCDCYHGYVFDESKELINNVQIIESSSYSQHTYSKSDGYFYLNRKANFISELIFVKEGYISDTIPPYTANRRGDKSLFVHRKDTLFMKRKE